MNIQLLFRIFISHNMEFFYTIPIYSCILSRGNIFKCRILIFNTPLSWYMNIEYPNIMGIWNNEPKHLVSEKLAKNLSNLQYLRFWYYILQWLKISQMKRTREKNLHVMLNFYCLIRKKTQAYIFTHTALEPVHYMFF